MRTATSLVQRDVGEDLAPELREVVVDDDGREQAGVHHFEQVVVFEVLGRVADHDRRLPALRELLVERDQAVAVGAARPREDLLAGQVVHRRNRRRARAGDQDLAHVRTRGIAEVHELLELGPDRDLGGHEVDHAIDERRGQHLARQRHEHHEDLVVGARLEVRVQAFLDELAVVVRPHRAARPCRRSRTCG